MLRMVLVMAVVIMFTYQTTIARAEMQIDPWFTPAWDVLVGIPEFHEDFLRLQRESDYTIAAALLPPGVNGRFIGAQNIILVSVDLLNEDPRAIATVIAHELTHANQASRVNPPDCVAAEVEAYKAQSWFWIVLTRPQRLQRTPLERDLTLVTDIGATQGDPGLYTMVVNQPGYQDNCNLWVPSYR